MLLRCIRAENAKLRGAGIWVVFLLVPLLSGAYGTASYVYNQGVLRTDWDSLWSQHTLYYALFFFAPMVAIYAAYLWRLEHLGHNWTLIMSMPVPPLILFLAKLVTVFKMALLTQGWMYLLFVLFGKLWAGLPGWPTVQSAVWALRGALATIPVIALQLLLSMLIRSFALPVLLALGGGVLGFLLAANGNGLQWPYALMLMGMNANNGADLLESSVWAFFAACVVFTLLFLALAELWLRKKDVEVA